MLGCLYIYLFNTNSGIVATGFVVVTQCTSSCAEAKVEFVGVTKLPYGQVPLMLYYGDIVLQTSSGKVATVRLETHNFDEKSLQDQPPEGVSVVSIECHCHDVFSRLLLLLNKIK